MRAERAKLKSCRDDMILARKGNLDLPGLLRLWSVVFALILFGAGCKKSDRDQVLIAAMTDNVQLLKQMDAKGADLNAQYPERFTWTPLITAIYFQNTNVIAYLLNRGVDVRKRDGRGETALMWAISLDDTNTATLLFQKSPRAIREGEDWPRVRSLIQGGPDRTRWNSLIEEFLRTNAATSTKP
jgi:ankyrin repeat protein